MSQTIFERYGGFASIRKIVSDFYDSVLDSELAHHFEHVEMRALIDHQTAFISSLTGGPGTHYTDEALRRVHASLDITDAEFQQALTILERTLKEHDFEHEDIAEVVGNFSKRRAVIVSSGAPT
jgi:hemoglobin